jgi:hypothetical protein
LKQLKEWMPCYVFRNCCNSTLMPRLPLYVLLISDHVPYFSRF